MDTSPQPASNDAESVLLAWMAAADRGDATSLEALCKLWPHLAPRLRDLHAGYERVHAILDDCAQLAPRAEPEAGPPAPAILASPRYELRGEIARGGMGTVLEVYDQGLRRTLALKMLRRNRAAQPDQESDRARRESRLLAEAQILAQLDHPGVVAIHEMGVDEQGRAYFTMKRVRGQDFGHVIRAYHAQDEAWTLLSAVGVLLKVCETVAFAHSKGVIHRDLKPANILVGRFGEVFVMDWGLAKVLGRAEAPPVPIQHAVLIGHARSRASQECGESSASASHSIVRTDRGSDSSSDESTPLLTHAGDVVGTPAYMPPEQARGDLDALDARADVYALGAMLYHLLAGRPPYVVELERDGHDVLADVIARKPDPLARTAPRAPDELMAICERAMARDVVRRYATMIELAGELRAWSEGRVVRAHKTGAWIELRKWVRRNRWAAATAGVGVLALGVLLVAQSLANRRILAARVAADARAEELRQQDALSRVALAGFSLSVSDQLRARQLLDGCPPDLRRWEWRYLSAEIDTSDAVFRVSDREVAQASFTRDGRAIVAVTHDDRASGDNRVTLWDAGTGGFLREIARCDETAIERVSFSADGKLLAAFAPMPALHLYRTSDWSALPSLEVRIERPRGACFAPEGHRLAAYGASRVEIWDADSHARLAAFDAGPSEVADVAWSVDGARLFAASRDGKLRAWDTATHTLLATSTDHDDQVLEIEASPDGRFLASAGRGQRLIVHDARTLAPVHRSERKGDSITALAWSPDGGTLAVGLGANVHVISADTWERVALLQGLHINTNSVEFDDTGRRILTGSRDGTARLWDLSLPDRKLVRGARGVEVAGIDFAPDDRRFAVAYVDGRIEIWDRALRDVLWSLRPAESLDCFEWSPAGSTFGLAIDAGPVWLVDARSGRTTGRVPGPCGDGFRFSPDGKLIAIPGSDGVLRVFDAEDGRQLWEARAYAGPAVAPSGLRGGEFSPDGSLIATCAASGEVQVWDAASGELVRARKGAAERYLAVSFSPDGERLCLWATQPPTTELWDAGSLTSAWVDDDDRPTPPVWSADVERLLTLSTEGGLGIWDARRGRMITLLDSPRMPRAKIAVARDGELVVTACATGVRFWQPRARE